MSQAYYKPMQSITFMALNLIWPKLNYEMAHLTDYLEQSAHALIVNNNFFYFIFFFYAESFTKLGRLGTPIAIASELVMSLGRGFGGGQSIFSVEYFQNLACLG